MPPRKKETSLEQLLLESKRLRERSDALTEEARTLSDKIAAMESAQQEAASRRDSDQQTKPKS
jgi:hypothetical protein